MAKFEANADGSTVVKLDNPIKVDGEELSRLTIPKLKTKHLFGAPPLTSIGMVLQWAANVVEPKGALDELPPSEGVEVGDFLFRALNGSPKTGEAPSP